MRQSLLYIDTHVEQYIKKISRFHRCQLWKESDFYSSTCGKFVFTFKTPCVKFGSALLWHESSYAPHDCLSKISILMKSFQYSSINSFNTVGIWLCFFCWFERSQFTTRKPCKFFDHIFWTGKKQFCLYMLFYLLSL